MKDNLDYAPKAPMKPQKFKKGDKCILLNDATLGVTIPKGSPVEINLTSFTEPKWNIVWFDNYEKHAWVYTEDLKLIGDDK